MLFIKNIYSPDISGIYFIEIIDQDITLNDIGYLKSFKIDKLHNRNTCTNTINTFSIKVEESLKQSGKYHSNIPCTPIFDTSMISNIINSDYQHDISNNNAKVRIYTINCFNELWYSYCDEIYLTDKQVMETKIQRWKVVNEEIIIHSLLHPHDNVSIPDKLISFSKM